MKSIARIALVAVIFAFPCLVSCNRSGLEPDDYGENTPTEEDIFWGVIGNLVDHRDITPDFKGKTFTAIIGSPDNGDASVRVVSVNTPAVAAARYNALTGASISETTRSDSWHNDIVGSLKWTLVEDNTAWATVDVNIPSVPGLHKIIYRSPEQGDVNGSVGDNGSAYYRFGDVIKRKRAEDNVEEYWICVRPSFGPEGKGNSHWISVSPLPKEDVWPYYEKEYKYGPFVASNRMEYGIPKHLGSSTEWHQDLAEMLFAIMYPQRWASNIQQYSTSTSVFDSPSGLPIFNGWHYKRVKYHNEAFWTNVQQQWKARDLVPFLFGISYDEMAAAINPNNANARGLHFLYEGSKWSISYSNKPTLYQVHYTHGTGNEEKNMHKETTKSVSSQVVIPRNFDESNTNYPFDVYKLSSARPYLSEARFFGDDAPRWIVRYRTGEELSSTGNYDPQQPIPGFTANHEIYRYYKNVFPEKNLTDEPEVTVEGGGHGFSGRAHYRWGNVYKDEKGDKWFVVNQAGNDIGADDPSSERSPYTELISFGTAGLTPTSNNARVTNLPTLDQALRCYLFLFQLTSYAIDCNDENLLDEDPIAGKSALNILRNAGVDVRRIMQAIYAQDNDPRNASLACCIAYNDPSNTIGQTLLRCIVNYQNPQRDARMYFWTLYPSAPDTQTQFVENFSSVKILLQDIADQTLVNRYATDTYARQPLAPQTLPNSDLNTLRSIRTQADERARDVRNYYFDATQFSNLGYPGSMWNEPVLVFRYTRVKDMGESDYSKTTVDGHTLTLLAERDWAVGDASRDETYDMVKMYASTMWRNLELIHLNGQHYQLKTWQQIKDNEINSK